MHTEEEAKTKWCQEVPPGALDAHCIASECMAWRWVNAPGPRPHDAPEEIYWGYCGKAGKP